MINPAMIDMLKKINKKQMFYDVEKMISENYVSDFELQSIRFAVRPVAPDPNPNPNPNPNPDPDPDPGDTDISPQILELCILRDANGVPILDENGDLILIVCPPSPLPVALPVALPSPSTGTHVDPF